MTSMQETLDLALELNCEFANFYCAAAYPGSELYSSAQKHNYVLPSEWHHYSQHSYFTLPLRNKNLSASDILKFRDYAFNVYFTNPKYQVLVTQKFGRDVSEYIKKMVKIPLPRKYVDEAKTLADVSFV